MEAVTCCFVATVRSSNGNFVAAGSDDFCSDLGILTDIEAAVSDMVAGRIHFEFKFNSEGGGEGDELACVDEYNQIYECSCRCPVVYTL